MVSLIGPLSLRTRYSQLKYVFPKTETSKQTDINLAFSTPKCSGTILHIPSRDLSNHHYTLRIKSAHKLLFEYKILDGLFTVTLKTTKSFCDGRIHYVRLRKRGRIVTYQVNEGKMVTDERQFIQKASLSKPDHILLGGTSADKFIGCLYNASVALQWAGNLPIAELDLVHLYAQGNPHVSGKDLFVGACANRQAGNKRCIYLVPKGGAIV